MYTSKLLSILSVTSIALSSPLAVRSETWPVSKLDIHFMGRDTGLPGNEWPETAKFDTTIDFTVGLPSGDVQCHGNWKYQDVATTPFTCSSNVEFQLSPTSEGLMTEVAFVLTIRRKESGVAYAADQEIRANNPGQPNSYLSCLGGPPLDGIRCHVTGWASTSSPLILNGDVVA